MSAIIIYNLFTNGMALCTHSLDAYIQNTWFLGNSDVHIHFLNAVFQNTHFLGMGSHITHFSFSDVMAVYV
jgi:hypothetical protein